ncbi:hypothetical protein PS395_07480 [Limosilactobacillus pontis]|uniref:hypothetical protein n=1 Tax=Limosilactobacillus pontis TaxID=35787 RepID=UPI002F26474E
MKKIEVNKNNLFCMGYSLFLIGQILGHTFINILPLFRYFLIAIGIVLVLLKIAVFDHITFNKSSLIKVTFLMVYLTVSLISTKTSGSIIPIVAFILIIGAYDVDFDSIVKIFIYTATLLLIITFAFYSLGLISESTALRNGIVRHSFGYRHPTDLTAMFSYILMGDMYLCIKYKRIIYPRIILYLFLGFFSLVICNARLGSITIFMLIPVLLFLYQKNSLGAKAPLFIIKNNFNIGLLLSIIITQLFATHATNFLVHLNQLISYRLTYQVMAVKLFGYSLWGQKIYQTYFQMFDNGSWFFIDSSYYVFLIQYGIVLLALWCTFFYLCQKRQINRGNYIIPVFFLIICIDSLIEQHLYSPEYNVFLLSLLANLKFNPSLIRLKY